MATTRKGMSTPTRRDAVVRQFTASALPRINHKRRIVGLDRSALGRENNMRKATEMNGMTEDHVVLLARRLTRGAGGLPYDAPSSLSGVGIRP